VRAVDGGEEAPEQQVRAVGVAADLRVVGLIADPREPVIELQQVAVGAQEPWDDNHG
jgi:hypothetical protein